MKISKQDLKNVIVESIAEHMSEVHMSDEDLMDYSKECPQGWKDADCMVNKILQIIDPLFQGFSGDPKELNHLKIELETALLDMALAAVPDDDYVEDDQGPGDELNMSARFAKKGSRNFGKQENEN
jgi:hypothetical protein